MLAVSQNSYVENLIPTVTILGSGTIEKWLGHEGRALMNEIRVLTKDAEILADPFYLGICPGRGPHSLYYAGTLILDF